MSVINSPLGNKVSSNKPLRTFEVSDPRDEVPSPRVIREIPRETPREVPREISKQDIVRETRLKSLLGFGMEQKEIMVGETKVVLRTLYSSEQKYLDTIQKSLKDSDNPDNAALDFMTRTICLVIVSIDGASLNELAGEDIDSRFEYFQNTSDLFIRVLFKAHIDFRNEVATKYFSTSDTSLREEIAEDIKKA